MASYIRRCYQAKKKYLQAVKALKFARTIESDSPELHVRIIDFKLKVDALQPPLPPHIATLVASSISDLIPADQSLEAYNTGFLQQQAASAPRILAAARSFVSIRGAESAQVDAEELIFQLTREEVDATISTCIDALAFLDDVLNSSRTEEFRAACQAHFPLSTVFKSAKDLASSRASRNFGSVEVEVEGVKVEEIEE